MFTQRLSMDCTKEQYEKFLKEELLKMGYKEGDLSYWTGDDVCITNYYNSNGYIGNISIFYRSRANKQYLSSFNAPLFLALAAMTDNPIGIDEEYYTNGKNVFIRKSELTKGVFIDGVFRKATKKEIMAKFSKTETDTNYDAKEQLDAINLLKSKGYKILKPKTWEEV